MLFIVTAQVACLTRTVEKEEEEILNVSHIVDADSANDAGSILIDFYEQKNDRSSPYGERYNVLDYKAFEPLSRDSIRTN